MQLPTASCAALLSLALFTSPPSPPSLKSSPSLQSSQSPLVHPYKAPELLNGPWLNVRPGDKLTAGNLTGHVTILHFWTNACINCKHNLPKYTEWSHEFDPNKVHIIGVHTPELDFERKLSTVKAAVTRFGITYPVLIDNESKNWNLYHQQFWPSIYIIDKNGYVRAQWDGELQYGNEDGFAELTEVVKKLEAER